MIIFSRTSLTASACSAALLASVLAGCSSSGGSSGSKLSKADFITQANAACASTLAMVKAAPTPSGPTDYADLQSYVSLVLTEEPKFLQTVTKLADQTADKAALHKNWIDPESSSFDKQKPVAEQLDAAAKAKDATKVTALSTQLSNFDTPDDSDYLTSYGLTQCAALSDFGNS